jgi:adenine deaminase
MRKEELKIIIDTALSNQKADVVIKNVDVLLPSGNIQTTDIAISGSHIAGAGESYQGETEIDGTGLTAVPGFIDAHFHVESGTVNPYEFERAILPFGTTTAICDPHELCNISGVRAIDYFLTCASTMLMDLYVQLPSCVPCSSLGSFNHTLLAEDLKPYLSHKKVLGLAEFMDFPHVWDKDEEVLNKLELFQDKIIDGHIPLVSGKPLSAYIAAGIRNCHETSTYEEGLEKINKGMSVLIREGSVAKDLEALIPLITPRNLDFIALCTDDMNVDSIVQNSGHISHIIRKAIALGASPADVYRIASYSAARIFGLKDRGLIAPGYRADIVLLSDFLNCRVEKVIKNGQIVTEERFAQRPPAPDFSFALHAVRRKTVQANDFQMAAPGVDTPIIRILSHSLVTEKISIREAGDDLCKAAVLERHGKNGNTGLGYVCGFGIRRGAIATTVGHDSHNLCTIGVSDEDMALACNRLIETGGGYAVAIDGQIIADYPLPIGGVLSDLPWEKAANDLHVIFEKVKLTGCNLEDPFVQLSFLQLPVIPFIKLTDYGLIDTVKMEVIAN